MLKNNNQLNPFKAVYPPQQGVSVIGHERDILP